MPLLLDVGAIAQAAFVTPIPAGRVKGSGLVENRDFLAIHSAAEFDPCQSKYPNDLKQGDYTG